jgi:hypothetical protein
LAPRGVALQVGAAETDFVITDPSPINGWSISSIVGRHIVINGVPVSPGQPFPERTMDGKYYVTISPQVLKSGPFSISWSYW